jgi:mannose-6-phosphate isomerase
MHPDYNLSMKDQYDLPAKLENQIQHYSWGSKTLIPELLGISNPQNAPFAELWMGVHPRGPSRLVYPTGTSIELLELITKRPVEVLGPETAVRFNRSLPFLFKVLAAEQPLSIQAHPNRNQAVEGFEEEEQRGIPVDAFERNYRDRNHKPEIICALTPFTALCGFRDPREIDAFYGEIEEKTGCRVYRDHLRRGEPSARGEGGGRLHEPWLMNFFKNLLTLEEEEKKLLDEAVYSWARSREGSLIEADLILKFHSLYPGDPGVQAPLFLNVVQLNPGQALYQPAGVLHAYVGGLGIELMANSDNVLRGGLTVKHIDVPELMRVLSFRHQKADILEGIPLPGGGRRYDVPIDEFQLFLFSLKGEVKRGLRTSLDIGICTEGEVFLKKFHGSGEPVLHLVKGESFFVPYSFGEYVLEGRGTVAIATVPAPEAASEVETAVSETAAGEAVEEKSVPEDPEGNKVSGQNR